MHLKGNAMSQSYATPEIVLSAEALTEDEWAIAAAVAAFLGIGVAVVAYICSVCGARSFWSCVSAVRNYWGRGC